MASRAGRARRRSTASSSPRRPGEVPPALLDQLSEGGRLVIPVGPTGEQDLVRITRTADGFDREQLSRVSFVPLVEGTG